MYRTLLFIYIWGMLNEEFKYDFLTGNPETFHCRVIKNNIPYIFNKPEDVLNLINKEFETTIQNLSIIDM
jgi:hypothetical protein